MAHDPITIVQSAILERGRRLSAGLRSRPRSFLPHDTSAS